MNSSLQPINWNLLRTFYGICQYPTLVEAGKHLRLTQSCLSRNLATLENSLGYRLFHRGARRLSLLEEGRELLALVAPVFQKFTEYQASHGLNSQIAQGILKVSVAPYLPVSWLMQRNGQFLEQYPHLSLNLTQQVSSSGNFSQYADCAVQFYDADRKDDLIQQPLGRMFYGLYATRRYLFHNGDVKQLNDLYPHAKLILRISGVDTPLGWPTSVVCDPKSSRLHEFSTAQDLLEATRQGLGIAALPRVQAEAHRELEALSLPLNDQEVMLYYAYPKYYKDLKRVTAFGDFLKDRNRIQANASSNLSQATEKEQPSSRLLLSYTTEVETSLPMHPQKTQVNSMALSKVMTTAALLSSLFVQACSVGMALNGQKDPDLTVIKKGADRDEIEFQLGDPKKVSVVGGETITSYEYQLNNESSAGRAVAHGVMDIMTLGIWEVVGTPVEMTKGDKFELEVVYDQQNKVKTLRKKSSNS